jgi:hypothetical protein
MSLFREFVSLLRHTDGIPDLAKNRQFKVVRFLLWDIKTKMTLSQH